MGNEPGRLGDAGSEALADFAAIAAVIDLSGEPATAEHGSAAKALRGAAVRHPPTAPEIMRRGEGGRG
jgi:hypothetical protein